MLSDLFKMILILKMINLLLNQNQSKNQKEEVGNKEFYNINMIN